MKAVIQFLTNKTVLSAIALIAFAVIIWFGGPLISVGEKPILADGTTRLLVILVVTILWGLNNLRKKKQDEEKTNQLLGGGLLDKLTGKNSDLSEAASSEQQQIESRFKEAMGILRKTKLNKAAGGLRLHELPWYIVIGPPGSGKTTAIVNSGLKFPLADSLGTQSVRGIGGTRDCDWWFTDEAVLIDTAGRYTTQDSDKEVDSSGWNSFLGQLKKYRKAKPINGVIVTIGFPELVSATDRERNEHAQRIKDRIKELREKLGIDFPVYFFVTKCDLVAGFNDFFEGFSKKEREQAWGMTFPLEKEGAERQSYKLFSAEFELLLQRLNSRVLTQMQHERDISKRARILAFPQEMSALKPIANDFIRNIFQPSKLDKSIMLRGIYFTSGTQQGTPIDRVLGSLATTFGLDQQSAPSFSGQGRSYFIQDVLSSVVFREAGLGDTKKSYQVQMDMLNKTAYAASVVVIVGAAIGWSSGFSDSERRIEDVSVLVEKYISEIRDVNTATALPKDVLPTVNALVTALEMLQEDREKWFVSGGLDESGKLGDSLESAYHRVLKTVFEPSLARFLEQQLISDSIDSETLFAALKTYLMLGDTSLLDTKAVNQWLASIWPLYIAGEPQSQERLKLHTASMLANDYQPFLTKPSYISKARERLNRVPLAQRVYSRLKETADASQYDLKTEDWLNTASSKSFRFKQNADIISVIPGFFTYDGFHKVFQKQNAEVAKATAHESWVLGSNDTAELNEREVNELKDNVLKLYLRDYEQTWRNLINNIEIVKFESMDQAVDVLSEFSGPASPLKKLLSAVDTNVALTRIPEKDEGVKLASLGAVGKKVDKIAKKIPKAKRNPNAPWAPVEKNFMPIASLADGGEAGAPPIDQTLVMIDQVKGMLQKVNGAPNLNEAAFKLASERVSNRGNDAIGRLRKHAQSLPAPVKNWVASLSNDSWGMVLNQSREYIRDAWDNDVYPEYERNITRRYPFTKDSETDVSLDDFARFFGPNGTLDHFFKNNMDAFINTRSRSWREGYLEDQGIGFNRDLLRNMQRAAAIRDTFFRKNPDTPSLDLILKPTNLDAKISTFTLDLDGSRIVYRHGPTRSSKVSWPGTSTSGEAKAGFQTTTGRNFRIDKSGTWALFRLFDEANVKSSGQYDLVKATFRAKSYDAEYEIKTQGVNNPLASDILHQFRLPKRI